MLSSGALGGSERRRATSPSASLERPFRGRRSLERASRRRQFCAPPRPRPSPETLPSPSPSRRRRRSSRDDDDFRFSFRSSSDRRSRRAPRGVELGGHRRARGRRSDRWASRFAIGPSRMARPRGASSPRARRGRGGVLLRREARGDDVPRGGVRAPRSRASSPERRPRSSASQLGSETARPPGANRASASDVRGEDDARGDERDVLEPSRGHARASSRRSASPPSPSGDAGVAAPCSRARSGNRGEPGRRPPSSDLASGFTHRPGRVVGIAPDPAPFASARPMVVRTSNEPSRGVSRAFQSPAGNQSPVGVGVERARVCGEGRLGNRGRP